MLQQEKAEDYVISTGTAHSVEDLVKTAFAHADLDWKKYVKLDERFVRPAEVDLLIGDSSKAEKELGWVPEVTFEQMIHMMVDSDIEKLKSKT